MKQLSLIISIVAIVLAGILFFQQIKNPTTKPVTYKAIPPPLIHTGDPGFKIAYFVLDSLETNYQYFKDVLRGLKGKEEAMNAELATLEKSFQKKIGEWQKKGNNMSQSEAEAANREYQEMQQSFQSRKQQLDQTMKDQMNESQKKIREKIESYLKEYNKDKNYAYIFSDFPQAVFYKDTAYNITNELIRGLNESYKKKN